VPPLPDLIEGTSGQGDMVTRGRNFGCRVDCAQVGSNVSSIMFKKFTLADKFFFAATFLTIVFSKVLYLNGMKEDAIFVGLWAPSILSFGIYLKFIQNSKDE
jgi:hypothetical protein